MYYIGIDLAWSENNFSGVALLKDNKLIYNDILKGIDDISGFISQYPNALVGIDAPLKVQNKTGNRDIEKAFLKDYSSKKLGVYPINRNLLEDTKGKIVGEEICAKIPQNLGESLFEVYPHATILECFHGSVLPYKRKKGRDTLFIKKQLQILQNYLKSNLKIDTLDTISNLKGKSLKHHEDKLDAIVCAYTLLYSKTKPYKLYNDLLLVPKGDKF